MSLEQNIADLVTATTRLTEAVDVRKRNLDEAVIDAADSATLAEKSAQTATESESSAISAKEAAELAAATAEAITGLEATFVPTPLKTPIARGNAKIDGEWVDGEGISGVPISGVTYLTYELDSLNLATRNALYGDEPYPTLDLRFAGADRINNHNVNFSRASKATYWDKYGVLREADIDEPRFTYDPVTGEALGLLLEPFTSTNLLLNSEVVSDQTVVVPSGDITLSFYGEGEVSFTGAATGTLQGAGGNDRAVITATAAAGELVLSVADGSPSLGQLEEGTAATSYIPTEGSQVTRAGDFFALQVGDWYRPDRGTLVITSATPDGELVAKLGEFEGYSNSNEARKYRATYKTTINATEIELGVGTFKSIQYYNRVLSRDTTTTV